jgi:hypothetical protein
VVRIAAEHSKAAMFGAYKLSNLLRPLGVPLPKIIAEGLNHRFPHLVLERLPGADLWDVIRDLSDALRDLKPGQTVDVEFARDAATLSSRLVLGER